MENTETKPKKKKPWVAESKSKPVIATNGWGEDFWFPSGRECARKLGVHQSGVNYCLTGQRKKVGGYRIRYAEPQ